MGATSSSYLSRIARQMLTSEASAPMLVQSADVANNTAAAALAAVVGKTNYMTGFMINGSGATAALTVVVTVTGLAVGSLNFIYCAAAGVAVMNTPLIINFDKPLPASAPNTAITVSCPALGTGAAHNVATIIGFQR